jgi:putative endonuclease
MDRQFFVYIMNNKENSVIYTGVTSNLKRRVYKHRNGLCKGFTRRYCLRKLVYFEIFRDPHNAISREKQIKAGSRIKKIRLVESMNPDWEDLWNTL